jgi:hypothetical protein
MPPYITRPATTNTPVQMLIPGQPAYAFGSKNTSRPTVKMSVTSVAVATDVVTLGVTLMEGYVPAVGDLITVVNTTTDSGAANVANVALASVTITALTGKGTVTYAATASDQLTTADTGMAYVAVPEIPEALSAIASRAFAIQNTIGRGYGITWAYNCSSAPSTIAIQLEGAVNDVDGEYTIIGTSKTTASGWVETVAQVPNLVNFLRVNITATTGGTVPTIIAKILLA